MRTRREFFLKLFVWIAAIGWGVSVLGTFLSWNLVQAFLRWAGEMDTAVTDPMIQYWVRGAAGIGAVIGFLFLCCAVNPKKYAVLLPVLAWCSIFESIVILWSGLALSLSPFPFLGDAGFCLITGIGILLSLPRRR